MRDAEALGCRLQEARLAEAEALHNLAQRPASWSNMDLGGFVVASCTNDYLAAERILDPAVLYHAHQALGS